jgi:alkylation response protein AidB-like acyl-CoA dehydrogenase
VELTLDAGQLELQQTVARFCDARFPLDAIAERELATVDGDAWAAMADLGVFGLLVPEADGGSGLGPVEAAIVFEQLGSHLVPGPALWSSLAAGLVDGAAEGKRLVGGIEASVVVDGAALVEHAADLDALVVLHDDAVWLHETADLDAPTVLDPLDPLTPVGEITGLAPGEGRLVGDTHDAARLRLLGTTLSAALLAGIADRALEVARSYALEREQFGVAIGSFQAVKHLLADMYLQVGLAQSATYAAAAVVQDPGDDDPVRAAAGAKLLASDAAITNASTAIQVLGGMGFTWEMLPNHLLKRAWVLEQSFGTAEQHAHALGSTFVASVGAGAP